MLLPGACALEFEGPAAVLPCSRLAGPALAFDCPDVQPWRCVACSGHVVCMSPMAGTVGIRSFSAAGKGRWKIASLLAGTPCMSASFASGRQDSCTAAGSMPIAAASCACCGLPTSTLPWRGASAPPTADVMCASWACPAAQDSFWGDVTSAGSSCARPPSTLQEPQGPVLASALVSSLSGLLLRRNRTSGGSDAAVLALCML